MKKWLPILCVIVGMVACQQDIVSDDPSLRLEFSHDTVLFDTVFTTMGSSTKLVMVYNPHKNALQIEQVKMRDGKYFQVNLDGENNMDQLQDITLRGGDSLFLFVRTHIDPLAENSPVLVEDDIAFHVNGNTQQITLQAYGQNIEKIQGDSGLVVYQHLHLTNQKPYLIYDTVAVAGNLTIEAGATVYMHAGASMYIYGSMTANGTMEQPIIFRGDRTDRLFDSVPYRMASGLWDGIYLLHAKETMPHTYTLKHVDILSGTVGLYVYSEATGILLPKLTLKDSRIHNHSTYGVVLQNAGGIGDHQPITEKLRQKFHIRRFAAASASTGKFQPRCHKLTSLHGEPIHDILFRREFHRIFPVGYFGSAAVKGLHHQRFVRCRTDICTVPAAQTIQRRHLDPVAEVSKGSRTFCRHSHKALRCKGILVFRQ